MSTSPIDAPLTLSSPPTGSGSKDVNKPFKVRSELLASTRLASKAQLLHHNRSLSIQVIAHEVFLLVIACTKCFAVANKEPPMIGILGGGNVGTTVIMTLLANGYRAERMALSTRQPDRIPRCEALKAPSALPMFQLLRQCTLKSVTIQIRHSLAASAEAPPLVISALCGVTDHTLSKACGSQAVVRVQPEVTKIASLWHEQHEEHADEEQPVDARLASLSMNLPDYQQGMAGRDQQLLPLRLAAEAIATQREEVRNLMQAFCLLCRRAWSQAMSTEGIGKVLFGDKNEVVMESLGQVLSDSNGEQQRQNEDSNNPFVSSNWPLEWEQDLVDL
ncbi:hypothetical protein PPTG_06736 [Phytophthora nicotianae INRA-310]|uniref:Pyrroline-5-carboxylate reductase catalytic N-terminal domain-containing protein n=1 Tax=Phytophthora nicotianae (strain INRA-310) TaxID=761204 RepID=W2QSJ9_PHYN3|nr:hypothetical protein PPTG_06736 [Phytophthora nicotianae INRA-310]ETN15469.1 hypothetical protein PPTG_06736 [Phytophthora nicotianae INRA-310]